jgi:hypothetical protein
MSVRVDLQGVPAGYFIDRRGALGVMTGQRTLLEYQAAGFFPKCEGFSLEKYLRIADSGIFCGFLRQGASVLACSAQDSSWIGLRKNKVHGYKHEEKSSQYKHRIQKFFIYCRYSNIPNRI